MTDERDDERTEKTATSAKTAQVAANSAKAPSPGAPSPAAPSPTAPASSTPSNTAVATTEGTRVVQKSQPSFFDSETVIRAPATGGHSEKIPPKGYAPQAFEADEKTVTRNTQTGFTNPESSYNTQSGTKQKGVEKISAAKFGFKFKLPTFKRKVRSNEWAMLIAALFVAYLVVHQASKTSLDEGPAGETAQSSTKEQFLSDMLSVMHQTKNITN